MNINVSTTDNFEALQTFGPVQNIHGDIQSILNGPV